MKKLLSLILALSMLCAAGLAVAEAAEPVTLNVAYMPNYGSLWAIEAAIQKGYMADENITVNLFEFADGPTIIAAMESGSRSACRAYTDRGSDWYAPVPAPVPHGTAG